MRVCARRVRAWALGVDKIRALAAACALTCPVSVCLAPCPTAAELPIVPSEPSCNASSLLICGISVVRENDRRPAKMKTNGTLVRKHQITLFCYNYKWMAKELIINLNLSK